MALPDLRFVQIQTHSRCNADCVFCPYVESWHAARPGVMDEALWLKILDDLAPFEESLNRGKFLPYFMQEPLIDKMIFTRLEQIYERFPKVFVELSTNGAALTETVCDRLLSVFEGRRGAVWVSFHGVDAASLGHTMKLDFERSLANVIRLLVKADGRLRVIIRGAGQARDGQGPAFFTRGAFLSFWQNIFAQYHIKTGKLHVDAFTYHDRAGTLNREDRGARNLNQGIVRQIGPGRPAFHCSRVTDWLHVDYQGNLRLCCMDYHHEVRLPNLREMSIVEYLQSTEYQNLLDTVSGRKISPADFICKRCTSPGG